MTEPSIDDQITQLVADLRAVYEEHNFTLSIEQLPSDIAPPSERAKIVFVGEVGSGKTTLINAIMRRRALLPVTPTRHVVALGAGQPEQIRMSSADGCARTAEVGELTAVITSREGTGTDHVEVMLEEPMLDAMTLFDTPGVGGLAPETSMIALSALQGATALVFVCAAGEKLSLAERDFLAKADQFIDHVVFVQSKIDDADDGGTANLNENREVLKDAAAPHKVRGFTFVAVSAELAEKAADYDDAGLLAESGIEALRSVLIDITAARYVHAQRNALRRIRASMETAYLVRAERIKGLTDPGSDLADVDTVKAQLDDLRRLSATWNKEMLWQSQDNRTRFSRSLRERRRAFKDQYRDRVAAAKPKELDAIADSLVTELTAWATKIFNDIDQWVQAMNAKVTQGVIVIDNDALTAELAKPDCDVATRLADAPRKPEGAAALFRSLREHYMSGMMGVNSAHLLGTAAAATGLATPFAGPFAPAVGLLAGGAVLVGSAYSNRGEQGRSDLQTRIDTTIGTVADWIEDYGDEYLQKAQRQLSGALDHGLAAAITETEQLKKTRVQGRAACEAQRRSLEQSLVSTLNEINSRWELVHRQLLALPSPS